MAENTSEDTRPFSLGVEIKTDLLSPQQSLWDVVSRARSLKILNLREDFPQSGQREDGSGEMS